VVKGSDIFVALLRTIFNNDNNENNNDIDIKGHIKNFHYIEDVYSITTSSTYPWKYFI